jgi:hypothetical protein
MTDRGRAKWAVGLLWVFVLPLSVFWVMLVRPDRLVRVGLIATENAAPLLVLTAMVGGLGFAVTLVATLWFLWGDAPGERAVPSLPPSSGPGSH